MRSTNCVQSGRVASWYRFCLDLLSDLSLPILAQRHCACSLNAFTPRFALHPSPHLRAGSLHFLAHVCVRSNVQMACPECTMPQVWLALVGRQAARNATLPGHRNPVPSGRGKVQGKIKGRGTLVPVRPCLHVGWRGTRFGQPCAVCGAKFTSTLIHLRALSAGLRRIALDFTS